MKKVIRKVNHVHKNVHKKTLRSFKKNYIGRLDNLKPGLVRRFVMVWMSSLLFIFIFFALFVDKFYFTSKAKTLESGGDLVVAAVNDIDSFNLNPFLAKSNTEKVTAKLTTRSLFQFNSESKMVADLAKTWGFSEDGLSFRININSVSGLDAEDVVYSLNYVKSLKQESTVGDVFSNVDFSVVDSSNIEVKMPKPVRNIAEILSQVPISQKDNLKKVIENIDEAKLFNYGKMSLVGAKRIAYGNNKNYTEVRFIKNNNFFGNGSSSNLDKLTIRFFENINELNNALDSGLASLAVTDRSINAELLGTTKIDAGTFLFYNYNDPLLADLKLRKALQYSINFDDVLANRNRFSSPISELNSENVLLSAKSRDENLKLFTESGYNYNSESNIMTNKDGTRLSISILTTTSPAYTETAKKVCASWLEYGVECFVNSVETSNLQANYLNKKQYQVLLFSISLADFTDPYSYFSSGGAIDGGLNFSNVKNKNIDLELDIARFKLGSDGLENLKKFNKLFNDDVVATPLFVPKLYIFKSSRLKIDMPSNYDSYTLASSLDIYNIILESKTKQKWVDKNW